MRYYYHITTNYWGNKKGLHPRKHGKNRAIDEPDISRICVAPNVQGCLIAVGRNLIEEDFTYGIDNCINIYKTVRRVLVDEPYKVNDSHITGEKWLTKPTIFKFVKRLEGEELKETLSLMNGGCGYVAYFGEMTCAYKLLLDLPYLNNL